jgi:manganese-dependent inorganic pyrophosphatase
LATLADIVNYEEFGTEIFKVRSSISDLSASDIVKSDFKEYDFKDGKFFLNQVETSDVDAFRKREDELLVAMKELKNKESYHSVITFITDILTGGSKVLVLTDDEEKMSRALGSDLSGEIYLPGIMSRKKQVVPMISNIFDK